MKRRAAILAVALLVIFGAQGSVGRGPTPFAVPSAFVPVAVPSSTTRPSVVPAVIYDSFDSPHQDYRPSRPPRQTQQRKSVSKVQTGAKRPQGTSISGIASWYCLAGVSKCVYYRPDTSGFDAYAAAGPRLRVAMGGGVSVRAPDPWRNRIVTVCGRKCVRVKLIDWCACTPPGGPEKLIDLYHDVYAVTGSSVKIYYR